jgi:1-aminocyclopropane-1-carboxylate deaminase/D-cysteine desulfhydrase-like pyridoxal-dependent ACC family enzyme
MEKIDFRDIPIKFTNLLSVLTPIERHGDILVKRDDKFSLGGVCGGKARTCFYLGYGADGLVTAGSRLSPQIKIVANVAKHFGVPCRCHTPAGELTPVLKDAKEGGAEIVQHRPGYNSVIIARAEADAKARRWTNIPFGMECQEAVRQTMTQVRSIPPETKQIVVSVGSGMSLCGILWGIKKLKLRTKVLGVVIGANPYKRLNKYAPKDWGRMVNLVSSNLDYHSKVFAKLDGVVLDPVYEGKCLPFIKGGDLFWIVGKR